MSEVSAEKAYFDYLDAVEKRMDARRGQEPPMEWGEKMGDDGYFCTPCWKGGDETGKHPHSDPPCDPIQRGER